MTVLTPLYRHWVLYRPDGSIAQAMTLQAEIDLEASTGLAVLELEEPFPGDFDDYRVEAGQLAPRLRG